MKIYISFLKQFGKIEKVQIQSHKKTHFKAPIQHYYKNILCDFRLGQAQDGCTAPNLS